MTMTPDPIDAPAICWGILGAGGIARKMADAITNYTASEVVAIGSRDLAKAQAFADETGIPQAYGSYEELVAAEDIDAIYVATPHSHHRDHAILAIEAGKHVLVEKPFTQNAEQAREVLAAAEAKGVYVQEAMWARYLPHYRAIRELIRSGGIGDVIEVHADHGQPISWVPRMQKPELAGGSLLDLGVYPISFAHFVLGAPDEVHALGSLTKEGVDQQVSMSWVVGGRPIANLSTTMMARTPCVASISGTEGRIEIDGVFYNPTTWRVIRGGNHDTGEEPSVDEHDDRMPNGFQYEAAALARNVAEGRAESDLLPWSEILAVMEIMDDVRAKIGVIYPNEA